jgi:thioredoxin reductase (NADPH)
MDELTSQIAETRRPQMYPTLEPADIARLRPFGDVRTFADGEAIARVGEVGHGLALVLCGQVVISGRDEAGGAHTIVTHGPGAFMGELAQLSGRPALVDAHARGAVEAVIIAPERLRAVLVAEADLGERIMRALILRRVGLIQSSVAGPVIVGDADHADVRRLESFLRRNGHPHRLMDPAVDPEAAVLVERFHIPPDELPIVLCPGGELLRNPTEAQLARCIGLVSAIDPNRAVYAASEGLSVLVLDCRAFGGQAGASARIENYLGFPTGISGMALMARAYNQAQKFGVEMAIPDEVASLEPITEGGMRLTLANGEQVRTRTVVVAAGARYRRLPIPELERFEAASVHYWASPVEMRLCAGQEVILVGAGNSAGQAVAYLASQVAKVSLVLRGPDLSASMSRYLIDRITGLPNVEILPHTAISGLEGSGGGLETVRLRDVRSGIETRRSVRHLFLFIGADPNTNWLAQSGVALDAKGFIRTGADLGRPAGAGLETSLPGVFAIGDVRSGSVKRVAAAVGEGAQVVAAIHGYLSEQDLASADAVLEPAR